MSVCLEVDVYTGLSFLLFLEARTYILCVIIIRSVYVYMCKLAGPEMGRK